MRVYLDNCCYNRPFDEQDQLSVRLETEAKLREPRDYTKWREENLFLDGDLHAEAERARAVGKLFRERYAPHVPTI